ncbi:uncharacterized protein LOC133516624, partial [Cydia pomonella]|uniref:uncharacterized protein LOC133516624 n=1 Tax=Cydia pomonella TaxID=82600 RepID=UPI002ADE038E
MTSLVKCNQCNIVIDEMLSYIQNKISVIDRGTLIKICVSAFTTEEIKTSKALLFESLPTDIRKIVRKNKGQEQRDLEDIVNLILKTDPEVLPVFVARNLEKLPPVTFDHIDVTKLIKDLTLFKSELNEVKSNYVRIQQLEEVRAEILNMKQTSLSGSICNVNLNKRGAAFLDSGPMGMSHFNDALLDNSIQAPITNSLSASHTRNELEPSESFIATVEQKHVTRSPPGSPLLATAGSDVIVTEIENCPAGTADRQCNAPEITRGQQNKENENGDPWITVERRKKYKTNYRYAGLRGIARDAECKFRAAEKKVPIFISNVHKEANERDIQDYVRQKTNETINLQKIITKKQTEHNAYKFFVSENKVSLFLDKTLWP